MCFRAMCMTWPPAGENVLDVLRPFLDAMPVLADPGYEGAGHGVHVPVKEPTGVKELDIDTRPGTRCCARCAAWASAASRY
jgi:hypothetical protein